MRTTIKILTAAAAIIALAVLWIAPAITQAQTKDDDTIPRLEEIVEDLLGRVDWLEADVEDLLGRVEWVEDLLGRLDWLETDIEDRLGLVDWLEADVEDLLERVDRLESIWEGPGPAIDDTDDTHCIIAFSGQMGDRSFLQHETVLRYLDQYGEMPGDFVLLTVKIDSETGETLLVYATKESRRWTVERWQGCSFEGSNDWQEAAG